MNKENQRILRRLGHPIIRIPIDEGLLESFRSEASEEFRSANKEIPFNAEKRWIEDYTLALAKIFLGNYPIANESSITEKPYGLNEKIDFGAILEDGERERQELVYKLIKYKNEN
jgi:hypothetical protein